MNIDYNLIYLISERLVVNNVSVKTREKHNFVTLLLQFYRDVLKHNINEHRTQTIHLPSRSSVVSGTGCTSVYTALCIQDYKLIISVAIAKI